MRIGIFGEFLGHGVFAIHGKKDWIAWAEQLTGLDTGAATTFMLIVGIIDILIAVSVLAKPIRSVLLWAAPLALFYLLQKNKSRTFQSGY